MSSWNCEHCGNTIDMKSFPETCPSCGVKHGFTALKAILQRDDATYAIAPHIPGGIITDFALLRKIADVSEKYGASVIKITSAGRFALVGFRAEDIDTVWKELNLPPSAGTGMCVRSVKMCPGTSFCKRGLQDSVSIGMELDGRYYGRNVPYKLKMGVSGCPNTCSLSTVKDIGLIGMQQGWRVVVGGFATGLHPRFADILADNLSNEDALALVDKVVNWYCAANVTKRLGRVIDSIGLDTFRKQIGLPCHNA